MWPKRILVLLTLGVMSCAPLEEDDWSFPLSRSFYSESRGGHTLGKNRTEERPCAAGEWPQHLRGSADVDEFALVLLVVLAFPVIVDVALLPVTLPHDLLSD